MSAGNAASSPIHDPALHNSPLFFGFSELEFNAVAAFLEPLRIKKGVTVFKEGDVGEDMFVLLSGNLNAYRTQSDGTQRLLFNISSGDFFGEMSVIAHEPRSATINAVEDSLMVVLQGIDFYRIIFEHPMIGVKMLKAISIVQNQWLDKSSKSYSDLMRWGEAARRRAITDDMTELYNRRFLEETIKDRISHSSTSLRRMCLLMLDLDKIHSINEKYGTQAGDKVIMATADILRSSMRSGDIAARLAGDEFAVLLPDTEKEDALLIAERIKQNVMEMQVKVPASSGAAENTIIRICTSIGIAEVPTHAQTTEDLVFVADMALRKAKKLGRNRVEMAD